MKKSERKVMPWEEGASQKVVGLSTSECLEYLYKLILRSSSDVICAIFFRKGKILVAPGLNLGPGAQMLYQL